MDLSPLPPGAPRALTIVRVGIGVEVAAALIHWMLAALEVWTDPLIVIPGGGVLRTAVGLTGLPLLIVAWLTIGALRDGRTGRIPSLTVIALAVVVPLLVIAVCTLGLALVRWQYVYTPPANAIDAMGYYGALLLAFVPLALIPLMGGLHAATVLIYRTTLRETEVAIRARGRQLLDALPKLDR